MIVHTDYDAILAAPSYTIETGAEGVSAICTETNTVLSQSVDEPYEVAVRDIARDVARWNRSCKLAGKK